jgi:hypothetical protein
MEAYFEQINQLAFKSLGIGLGSSLILGGTLYYLDMIIGPLILGGGLFYYGLKKFAKLNSNSKIIAGTIEEMNRDKTLAYYAMISGGGICLTPLLITYTLSIPLGIPVIAGLTYHFLQKDHLKALKNESYKSSSFISVDKLLKSTVIDILLSYPITVFNVLTCGLFGIYYESRKRPVLVDNQTQIIAQVMKDYYAGEFDILNHTGISCLNYLSYASMMAIVATVPLLMITMLFYILLAIDSALLIMIKNALNKEK